jgi:hypothetical protein
VVSCTSEGADVTLTVEVPPADETLLNRLEALSPDAENVDPIGTVTGPDGTVLIASFTDNGEDCVGVFDSDESTTGCGGLNPIGEQWIVLQSGGNGRTALLVATPPEATEIRVTADDGTTYSASTLGEYGYIAFDSNTFGPPVLSIWAGDELIHEQ